MNNIIKRIKEYYPVSEESLNLLRGYFKQQIFPANTILIQAGRPDRKVYFIENGMTRSYILHDGKDVTTWFSMEGDAACGSWDLCRNKAGFEYVETLEKTTAYSISIEKLNDLYKTQIDIANWMRVLQQENFLRLQDSHISRLNLSARERYEKLAKRVPRHFQPGEIGTHRLFFGNGPAFPQQNPCTILNVSGKPMIFSHGLKVKRMPTSIFARERGICSICM